ncbi:MAG: tetratricopeptide repeat protein, partial [Xanthomonadaceae bacterium]|nr:tetratricopeptide repeat protein [Xanthomonadaceae bacterium]
MIIQSSSPALTSLLQKARGELARRQFDAAATTLESVLAKAPDCAPAMGMAAIAAQMRGKHGDAVAFFHKAIAQQSQDAGLHAGLGISLFESGDVEGAVTALRRACELAPNIASGWFNLGRALKLQVRTDEAIDALRRALQIDPVHVSARLTLADALASVGETDTAASELRCVLKAHPGQARAWFALANLKVVPISAEEA